ncbi:uncharacterized protein LOC134336800 isoform X1 [Mobula hypostoma]|uniref:uncharacterized protein LOC134336800 isoform X1 n=1 Tax=Mobula hypostoma TaxID=723540 RepID=UPI002FC35493
MHSLLDRKKDAGAELGFAEVQAGGLLPQVQRMWSGVGCLWVLLSSCLVAVCSFSIISPAWIVKEQGKDSVSFGLLWHCSEAVYNCYTFGSLGSFADIPSGSWQGAVHNPDLMETAVRSTEEHLEQLLKCPLRCRCYCAIENLRREGPKSLALLIACCRGRGWNAQQRWCSVSESWSEARSFRTDSESDCGRMLPGCCIGKLAALEVTRLCKMMGLSRDFETFTMP